MLNRQPKQHCAATNRAVVNADLIEWEELPSLARRVVHRGANDTAFMATSSFGTVWDNTMPAALDPADVAAVSRADRRSRNARSQRARCVPALLRHGR